MSLVSDEEGRKAYLDCEYTVGMYCGRNRLIFDTITLLKKQREQIETLSRYAYNVDVEALLKEDKQDE